MFTSVQQDNYLINGNYKLNAEWAGLLLDIHQNQKLVDSVPDFDIVVKLNIPMNIPSKIPVISNIFQVYQTRIPIKMFFNVGILTDMITHLLCAAINQATANSGPHN